MDALWLGARLLVLLAAANVAPMLLKRVLGARWGAAIDGGLRFVDGRPLLGPSKTWRGIVGAVVTTALVAPMLGFDLQAGAIAGFGSMAGDLLSSFTKRRLGVPSSGQAFGIDQVPEALVPLLLLRAMLDLSWAMVAGVTLAFLLCETPAAWLSYRLGIRETPW
jgi:hypothetical protein